MSFAPTGYPPIMLINNSGPYWLGMWNSFPQSHPKGKRRRFNNPELTKKLANAINTNRDGIKVYRQISTPVRTLFPTCFANTSNKIKHTNAMNAIKNCMSFFHVCFTVYHPFTVMYMKKEVKLFSLFPVHCSIFIPL